VIYKDETNDSDPPMDQNKTSLLISKIWNHRIIKGGNCYSPIFESGIKRKSLVPQESMIEELDIPPTSLDSGQGT
jgi:hypothetical protein